MLLFMGGIDHVNKLLLYNCFYRSHAINCYINIFIL